MEFPEWMADSYLIERLHRLGNETLPRPLVALSGDAARGSPLDGARAGAPCRSWERGRMGRLGWRRSPGVSKRPCVVPQRADAGRRGL